LVMGTRLILRHAYAIPQRVSRTEDPRAVISRFVHTSDPESKSLACSVRLDGSVRGCRLQTPRTLSAAVERFQQPFDLH
jgi:hypothetical protein